jgi:flagellar L-ring protein precursor FlgH
MIAYTAFALAPLTPASLAHAQNLYHGGNWPAMTSDRRASEVGDTITVVIYENAASSNTTQDSTTKSNSLGGGLSAGSINESGNATLGSGYTGRGEIKRSEQLVGQLTVTVTGVLPNGDLLVEGHQQLRVNGETTNIAVRGRIRPADISDDNQILSNRIADAQIDYNGKGFTTRSARPGLLSKLFSLFGLI